MDRKEYLKFRNAQRHFLARLEREGVPASSKALQFLDSEDYPAKLRALLDVYYERPWTSHADRKHALQVIQEWLSTRNESVIAWIPDTGALIGDSRVFSDQLDTFAAVMEDNLLFSTTTHRHGCAFLKCEHTYDTKSW